ncbi:GntR family transcriptional regulator [Streptomyces platensis]|uniref:GntR family transcriptional regulator n=1 Tax=Streptomyces platensis TaxID=58346 RepID=UPI002E166832|nr:GntR family transcriptional regulator [Streptomyces platensis]
MDAPHDQLAATLRHRITEGVYPSGSRFPSVRSIAREHKIGLGAAYLAVEALRSEGLLEGQPRRRLTVAHPVGVRTLADPDAPWPHGQGDVERSNMRADADLAVRLGVEPRTVLQRERVELLDPDGRPAMVVTTWRRGARHPHASHRVTVRTERMARQDADLLGLAAGIPVLVVQRTRYSADGAPVEVADLVLPSDRWQVSL